MRDLRIIFMGTPEFAVGILDAMYQNKYNIVAVITAADKPAGRGQKIKYSAVKQYALDKNLPLLQPVNLKDPAFLEQLDTYDANLQVVVAFRMLPQVVWDRPKYGTFNLHASLLPDYRGAAPINWAIINGETQSGVTTFFIDQKIDTGAIILKNTTDILPNESAGELHDRLMDLGAKSVLQTLELIKQDKVELTLQPAKDTKTAYKLNKDNCKIDFSLSGMQIYNHIRGLSPYPAAWCEFKDQDQSWNVKIYQSIFHPETHNQDIGSIIASKKELKIAVRDGFIEVLRLQFPGKKPMITKELLNGMSFSSQAKAM
ncbi:methionyl-tRNA formyltransferase [Myroides sp. LJL119]